MVEFSQYVATRQSEQASIQTYAQPEYRNTEMQNCENAQIHDHTTEDRQTDKGTNSWPTKQKDRQAYKFFTATQTDRQTDTDRHTDALTNTGRMTDRQTAVRANGMIGKTYEQTDRDTRKQTGRPTSAQAGRQTHSTDTSGAQTGTQTRDMSTNWRTYRRTCRHTTTHIDRPIDRQTKQPTHTNQRRTNERC